MNKIQLRDFIVHNIFYEGYGEGLRDLLFREFINDKDREKLISILDDWLNILLTKIKELED